MDSLQEFSLEKESLTDTVNKHFDNAYNLGYSHWLRQIQSKVFELNQEQLYAYIQSLI